MKAHPQFVGGERRFTTSDEDLNDLVEATRSDWGAMQTWLEGKQERYETRYSMSPREANEPWVGASGVNLPMSDATIKPVKANYMAMVLSGRRIATMQAIDSDAVENLSAADRVMENTFRGHGIHAMQDFELQLAQHFDSVCMFGLGILKTHWDYRTRLITERVRKTDLPGILGRLKFDPDMTRLERQEMQARFDNPQDPTRSLLNTFEVTDFFGEPVNPVNREVFDRHAERFEELIINLYGWDKDEPEDAIAIKEMMTFLRNGAQDTTLLVTSRGVIRDAATVSNVPIQDLILPPGALLDLSRIDRVTHRLYYSESELRQRAAAHRWDAEEVDKALEGGERDRTSMSTPGLDALTTLQDERADNDFQLGIEESVFEIWEACRMKEIDGEMRRVLTTYEANSMAKLLEVDFPYDHGEAPYAVTPFEMNEPGYFAPRGIPEILQDIESHNTAWHRWLENMMMISTSMTYTYNVAAFNSTDEIEIGPGMGIPRRGADDITPLVWPQPNLPVERMEQFYMLWPERLIGSTDPSNLGDSRLFEPRTATEVSGTQQRGQTVMGMHGLLWQPGFRKVLRQIWELNRQYLPDRFWIALAGSQPEELTAAQIRGTFDVRPAGGVNDMDPNFRAQQKLQIFQLAAQAAPLLAGDLRWKVDVGGALNDYLEEILPVEHSTVLLEATPEQIASGQQQREQEAARLAELAQTAKAMQANSPVTPEQAQALLEEIRSISPHKGLQLIIDNSNGARAAAENGRVLAR